MKTCTISQAKAELGRLVDAAIKGEPTVITRRGKLVILQAYALPNHADEFDARIQTGKESRHRALTPQLLDQVWKRGITLAKRGRIS
jgi:prevent-host-death family protein